MTSLPALRLFTSNGSPFCLKVMVLARELNLIDHLTLDYSVVPHPTKLTTPHSHLVPHGKIPCLLVDETVPIYGSENICAYLDSISGGKALPPPGTLARFEALTTEALASGIMDAALSLRYERVDRPVNLLWPEWVEGQLSKITRAVPMLAARNLPDPASEVLGLDGIAAAISLYYIDRRAADASWKTLEGGAKLAEWLEKVQQRPSWTETPFVN